MNPDGGEITKDANKLVEAVHSFVTFQKDELAMRERELESKNKELELQHSQAKMAYDYSIETLRANERTYSEHRKLQTASGKWAVVMVIIIALIFAGLVILAMYWNKDDLISEIIRAIILILGSGSVGFALGKRSKTVEQAKQ